MADLNADGRTDIATANGGTDTDGDVGILLNTGSSTFVAANYPAGSKPSSIALSDLNGDGFAELATASGDCGVIVVLNKGNGTFGPQVYLGGLANFVAVGDLNGDGKADLVATNGDALNVLLSSR